MEKNQKIDLTKFEVMVETQQGQLVGGFSIAASSTTTSVQDPVTNNCGGNNAGGNCIPGCSNTNIACL